MLGLHTTFLLREATALLPSFTNVFRERLGNGERVFTLLVHVFTLLLVNGRYAYANLYQAVLLFSHVCPAALFMTAARPQEYGGVSHLRRDNVRARGRPDGSTALQHARRTNVQVRTKICCLYMSLVTVCKMYLKNRTTSSQWLCGTVVTVSI